MAKNQMPIPPGARPEDSELSDSEQHDLDAANEPIPDAVIPKPMSRKKVKVRALRAGFIHNERKVEGDKFEVDGHHQLGSWMECEDPVEQKNHLKRMMAKKQKANLRGVRDQEKELADE